MLEIRTFNGDMCELAEFCNSAWLRRYRGEMPVAQWSPDFLAWELDDATTTSDLPAARELLVAAYDGSKLVGVLPARPLHFHIQGQTVAGSWGSYFSVDPDYENQPVALKLHLEQRRRHKEHGLRVNFGYAFTGYAVGRGQAFWLKQPKLVKSVRRLGTWVRALDPAAVARFSLNRLETAGLQIARFILGAPRPPRNSTAIRAFTPADASACAALLDAASRRADVGYAWNETFARRQLGFTAATRTLVAEHDGRVAGLINYCDLPLMGRAPITAGLIDFLETSALPHRTAVHLVRSALRDMHQRGLHLAMALRTTSMPFLPLARTAFTMIPAEYTYVAQPIDFDLPNWQFRRLHVHLR
jgi:predicted N-acetyltransferase YhbS